MNSGGFSIDRDTKTVVSLSPSTLMTTLEHSLNIFTIRLTQNLSSSCLNN